MDPKLTPAVLFGQLIGYGLSSTLALLLAVLAWQSPDVGRRARTLNAACAAVWSLGGLARFGLLAAGLPVQSTLVAGIGSLPFGAAAAWPVCLLLFWSTDALAAGRRHSVRGLLRTATGAATVLVVGLVVAVTWLPQGLDRLHMLIGCNALIVMGGGILILRPRIDSAVERVAVALILSGPLLSMAAHRARGSEPLLLRFGPALDVMTKQSMVLTLLGGLIYLGRFQASDRFAKLGLRVVFAWALGLALAWIVAWPADDGPMPQTASDPIGAALVCVAVAASVLLSGWVARASDRWVDRRVFGRRDPQAALTDLRERLARDETDSAVFDTAEQSLRRTLNIDARVVPRGESITDAVCCPVQVGEAEPFVLSMCRGARRRLLLSSEMDVMRHVAQLVGRRLEAIERERERFELSRREATLTRQVVEAELRALRAQINPHFLFNALNTIAALVHQDPAIAEAMTLRLARIFRYVLMQTDQSFSPLHEEMDFLRAYLDIEQMRFGERLRVEFQVADAVSDRPIPSLILQPLVENAIKHGFAPKLGECCLVIGGSAVGEHLVLSIRDNGVGVPADAPRGSLSGIGLRNVRDRLATVYGGRAQLLFESRPRRGSCATVYLPLHDRTAVLA